MWSIQETINSHLRNTREKRPPSQYWYASEMGTCRRKQFYRRQGIEQEELDDRTLRVFAVGDIFHKWIQDLLAKEGVLIKAEGEVINEEYGFKGRYDALVEKDGHKILYDFKTVHSRKFHWLDKQGIDEHYKLQVASYVVMGGIDAEPRILYLSKDDLCVAEYPINIDEFSDKVLSEIKELNELWEAKKLPEQLEETNWQCGYCSFVKFCRGADWTPPKKVAKPKRNPKKS